ncbi:MAG: prephenate dehydrogenase [Herpetosiphonaceae bacterium]|nr:prephenate dehydrogenase [Herpetosiphonaceae bacterium]
MNQNEAQLRGPLGQRAIIVGLGLIGGSLAAALKLNGLYAEVLGVDTDRGILADALDRGLIDVGVTLLHPVVADADLIVLATPVRQIVAILRQIGPAIKPGAIVLDVGGTKEQIVSAMNALPTHVQAMGGHPMSGKNTSGLEHADAQVFRDKIFILTPTAHTSFTTQAFVEDLVLAIGARPLVLDAVQHDQVVALISHLPRLLPLALIDAAQAAGGSLAWAVAAGGFRESTKKATDNVPMWLDVLLTNPHGIVTALRAMQEQLDKLAQQIAAGDEVALRQKLEQAATTWNDHFGTADPDAGR